MVMFPLFWAVIILAIQMPTKALKCWKRNIIGSSLTSTKEECIATDRCYWKKCPDGFVEKGCALAGEKHCEMFSTCDHIFQKVDSCDVCPGDLCNNEGENSNPEPEEPELPINPPWPEEPTRRSIYDPDPEPERGKFSGKCWEGNKEEGYSEKTCPVGQSCYSVGCEYVGGIRYVKGCAAGLELQFANMMCFGLLGAKKFESNYIECRANLCNDQTDEGPDPPEIQIGNVGGSGLKCNLMMPAFLKIKQKTHICDPTKGQTACVTFDFCGIFKCRYRDDGKDYEQTCKIGQKHCVNYTCKGEVFKGCNSYGCDHPDEELIAERKRNCPEGWSCNFCSKSMCNSGDNLPPPKKPDEPTSTTAIDKKPEPEGFKCYHQKNGGAITKESCRTFQHCLSYDCSGEAYKECSSLECDHMMEIMGCNQFSCMECSGRSLCNGEENGTKNVTKNVTKNGAKGPMTGTGIALMVVMVVMFSIGGL